MSWTPMVVGGVLAGGAALWALRRWLEAPVAHIRSGEQRRALYPEDHGIGPGAKVALSQKDVTIRRRVFTLKHGEKMFYQLVSPVGKEPTHILVYLHGYTSHSDLYLEAFSKVARAGALVVIPDLPCHGRSDGLLGYIPDWWAWVDSIWEFMDSVVLPLRSDSEGKTPKKVFGTGMSLGGGLAACLAVMRPTFFDGVVLIAPMLFVSDEIKPPMIVQILFRNLLGPLKLTLPLTPCTATDAFDFRVPSQGSAFTTSNPLSMLGLRPRLATAKELGFTFPEWMQEKMKEMRTPFLILHGTMDKVTDPETSKQLYAEAPVSDKQLKLYDGAFHCDLLCCLPGNARLISGDWLPEQVAQTEECLRDLTEWIAARS